jgi:hypothetical protein
MKPAGQLVQTPTVSLEALLGFRRYDPGGHASVTDNFLQNAVWPDAQLKPLPLLFWHVNFPIFTYCGHEKSHVCPGSIPEQWSPFPWSMF